MVTKSTGRFERDVFDAWRAEPGDPDPRLWSKKKKALFDRLVIANLPFARQRAAKMAKQSSIPTEIEDLEQAGAMGIMRALETYNPERGAFTTYAAHWVRYYIQRALKEALVVTRPDHSGMPYKTWLASEKIRVLHGREPTAEEWAELGVRPKDLRKWECVPVVLSMHEGGAGRDAGIVTDGIETSRGASHEERIADPAGSAEDLLLDAHALQKMSDLIPTLKEDERRVIEGLFFEGETPEALAQSTGFSKVWISELRSNALRKLRKRMTAT